jgi:hypothetical protein
MGRRWKKKTREGSGPRGERGGKEGGPRVVLGKGFGVFFLFFQILFNKIFKTFQIQIFTQLFSKLFTNIFTIILKDLSQILLKTFKTTPQPKLMHSKMMRKHLGDSNY